MATVSIGAQIDALNNLRSNIRNKSKVVDDLRTEFRELEHQLIASLDAQGVEQSRGSLATATITKQVVPNVVDWEDFHTFVKENDAFYLLERRASAAAYRELLEAREGEAIPGVQPYEKVGLSLRSK